MPASSGAKMASPFADDTRSSGPPRSPALMAVSAVGAGELTWPLTAAFNTLAIEAKILARQRRLRVVGQLGRHSCRLDCRASALVSMCMTAHLARDNGIYTMMYSTQRCGLIRIERQPPKQNRLPNANARRFEGLGLSVNPPLGYC